MEAGAPAARAAGEDVRVVEQPIEQRGHGGGIAEELAPILDGPVRGDSVESNVKLLVIGEVERWS